eukprot:gene12309-7680_t
MRIQVLCERPVVARFRARVAARVLRAAVVMVAATGGGRGARAEAAAGARAVRRPRRGAGGMCDGGSDAEPAAAPAIWRRGGCAYCALIGIGGVAAAAAPGAARG